MPHAFQNIMDNPHCNTSSFLLKFSFLSNLVHNKIRLHYPKSGQRIVVYGEGSLIPSQRMSNYQIEYFKQQAFLVFSGFRDNPSTRLQHSGRLQHSYSIVKVVSSVISTKWPAHAMLSVCSEMTFGRFQLQRDRNGAVLSAIPYRIVSKLAKWNPCSLRSRAQ